MKNFNFRHLISITFFLFLSTFGLKAADCSDCFITKWKVENGEALKMGIEGDYSYIVEDLDENIIQTGVNSGNLALSGLSDGEYILKLSPDNDPIPMHRFFMNASESSKDKLLEVMQWGAIVWSTFEQMFFNCTEMIVTATDIPNADNVTSMKGVFRGCSKIETIPNMNDWDVSHVTDMSDAFNGTTSFNQPIGNWNVSGVTNMNGMFWFAHSFNQPIGNWDVNKVENMKSMFNGAESFNQPIGNWEVGHVEDMSSMFRAARAFNQPVGDWDVSHVKDMTAMFDGAFIFNQPLNNWNVSNVEDMDYMFSVTQDFNQPLNNWDVSSVKNMRNMFASTNSFNQPIGNWNVSQVENMQAMFLGAVSFNQSIDDWDVGKVINMAAMFDRAPVFNQPLNNWDVSSVEDMSSMFQYNSSFNQQLNNWDVSHVRDMTSIFEYASSFNQNLGDWNIQNLETGISFYNSGMSCKSYSYTLLGWSQLPIIPQGIRVVSSGIYYSPDIHEAREKLINQYNWIISSGSEGSCSIPSRQFTPFITKWNVENDKNLVLGIEGDYEYEVEDLSENTIQSGTSSNNLTLTGLTEGEYILKLTPIDENIPMHRFYLYGGNTSGASSLLEVIQWGNAEWSTFENMFYNCRYMTISATDIPDLSHVTRMNRTFGSCTNLGTVPNMNDWDVSHVENMSELFAGSVSFNQPIGNWDVSNIKNFYQMFFIASSFNQNLGNWNLKSAETLSLMFSVSGMSCENYSATLIGWAGNSETPDNLTLTAAGVKYDADGENARNTLISKGWTITDDGVDQNCGCEDVSVSITAEGELTFCEGGSVILTADASDTYLWNTGEQTQSIEVNGSGTYYVEVTQQSCTIRSEEIQVTVFESSTTDIDATICEGDSYTLPDGSQVNTTGAYTAVLPSSAGCDSTVTVNLIVHNVSTTRISATICKGDSYTLPDGNVVSNAGIYTIGLQSSSGCDSTVIVNLTVDAVITVSANLDFGGNVSGGGCYPLGTTVTVLAQANPDYEFVGWFENGVIVSTELEYTFTVNGSRNLEAEFSVATGIGNRINETILNIFPNPFDNKLQIYSENEHISSIRAYNVSGRLVFESLNINSKSVDVNTGDFVKGIYVIQIRTDTGYTAKSVVKLD